MRDMEVGVSAQIGSEEVCSAACEDQPVKFLAATPEGVRVRENNFGHLSCSFADNMRQIDFLAEDFCELRAQGLLRFGGVQTERIVAIQVPG